MCICTHTNTHDRAAARSFVYPSRRSRVNAPRRLRLVLPDLPRSHLLGLLFVTLSTYLWCPACSAHASLRLLSFSPTVSVSVTLPRGSRNSFPSPFSLEPTLLVFVVPHVASACDSRLCRSRPSVSIARFLFSLSHSAALCSSLPSSLTGIPAVSFSSDLAVSLLSGSLLSFHTVNICRLPPWRRTCLCRSGLAFRTLSSFHVERRCYSLHFCVSLSAKRRFAISFSSFLRVPRLDRLTINASSKTNAWHLREK